MSPRVATRQRPGRATTTFVDLGMDALDRISLERLDPARAEAQRSEASSMMRKVDHGVTVDDDTFKMAEKVVAGRG